ncbi:MAG: hypothetical protein F9K32_00410 [Desulfobulbaceae bacterium]|nr:MAG: hypothetical protein F9K32_00410 [Desulfobulbaceae bacterium]
MNFMQHLEKAWQNTLGFIGPLLLITVVQILVTIVSFGILAPVTMAGYTQSLLLAQRDGRPPEIRDLFSTMSLFFPLFGFFLLVSVAILIGFMFLVLPGFVVAFLVIFATMYMMPLMTDRGMTLLEAIKVSWEMAIRPPLTDQLVVSLACLIILSVGGSIPFAILVAQPFAMLLLLSVYEQRSGRQVGKHRADQFVPPPLSSMPSKQD